jgi:hypothetical protein
MPSLTEGYLSPCPSLPLPPSNKESLDQITPLHVVILGPTFPYIWCHDSGQGSPLILVAKTHPPDHPRSHPTPDILWWVHTPLLGSHCGLSLWCLWGFNISPFWSSLGLRQWGKISLSATAWVYYCRLRPSQATLQEKPGAGWPIASTGLNSATAGSRALCVFSDICAVRGRFTVHNILLSHSGTRSLIMGASTSSLLSDSPLRCLLKNLDTLGLTPDIKPKI